MEQGPGVLDPSSLGVSRRVLIIFPGLWISQVDCIRHGDPGSGVIGGGPDAGVEDAAEPDDQADDAGRVHGGAGAGLLGHRGRVLVTEHLLGQVQLAVGVGLVGHGRPGQVHHVQGHKAE